MNLAALMRSEFKRLLSTRGWVILLGASVLVAAVYVVTMALSVRDASEIDVHSGQGVATVLFGGGGAGLFASLMAVLLVSSEFRFRTVGMSVLESGSRCRWFCAKLPVVLGAGLLVTLVTQLLAILFGLPVLWNAGVHPDLLGNGLPRMFAGIVLVGLPAALWGAAIGLLVRSRMGAVFGLIIYTVSVEMLLLDLAPSVGKWLIGGGMGAIMADPTTTDFNNLGLGLGVCAAWIIIVGALGLVRLSRTDIPQ